MKRVKIILLTGILGVALFATDNKTQKDLYLEYTNKVINYSFKIDKLEDIKSPFYENSINKKVVNTKKVPVKKSVKITLISIFMNKAFIRIDEYLGAQLVGSVKKWIGLNDKIYDCTLIKLTSTDAIFKCANSRKMLFKTINQKIPQLRDSK